MKIVFTTSGSDFNAALDSRFGRAAKFLVYDTDTNASEVIDNQPNLNAAQGAGIQAAETVARTGSQCLITGHCGPKAFRVLSDAGIKIFNSDAATVSEALRQYLDGKLVALNSADVGGHWA